MNSAPHITVDVAEPTKPLLGVLHCLHKGKVKKLWCVSDNVGLELHESEKKWKKGQAPKTQLPFGQWFNVNHRLDPKLKESVAVVTEDDFYVFKADKEETTREWAERFSDGYLNYRRHNAETDEDADVDRPMFDRVYDVIVCRCPPRKGGGDENKVEDVTEKQQTLLGAKRLCFHTTTVYLYERGIATGLPKVQPAKFPSISVSNYGNKDKYFMVRVGRSAETGSGELWMLTDSAEIASRIYDTHKKTLEANRDQRDRANSSTDAARNPRVPWSSLGPSSLAGGNTSTSIRDRSASNSVNAAAQRDRATSLGQAKLESFKRLHQQSALVYSGSSESLTRNLVKSIAGSLTYTGGSRASSSTATAVMSSPPSTAVNSPPAIQVPLHQPLAWNPDVAEQQTTPGRHSTIVPARRDTSPSTILTTRARVATSPSTEKHRRSPLAAAVSSPPPQTSAADDIYTMMETVATSTTTEEEGSGDTIGTTNEGGSGDTIEFPTTSDHISTPVIIEHGPSADDYMSMGSDSTTTMVEDTTSKQTKQNHLLHCTVTNASGDDDGGQSYTEMFVSSNAVARSPQSSLAGASYALDEVRSYISDSSDSCYSSMAGCGGPGVTAPTRAYSFGAANSGPRTTAALLNQHLAERKAERHRRAAAAGGCTDGSAGSGGAGSSRTDSPCSGIGPAVVSSLSAQDDPRKRAYSLGSKSWLKAPFRKISAGMLAAGLTSSESSTSDQRDRSGSFGSGRSTPFGKQQRSSVAGGSGSHHCDDLVEIDFGGSLGGRSPTSGSLASSGGGSPSHSRTSSFGAGSLRIKSGSFVAPGRASGGGTTPNLASPSERPSEKLISAFLENQKLNKALHNTPLHMAINQPPDVLEEQSAIQMPAAAEQTDYCVMALPPTGNPPPSVDDYCVMGSGESEATVVSPVAAAHHSLAEQSPPPPIVIQRPSEGYIDTAAATTTDTLDDYAPMDFSNVKRSESGDASASTVVRKLPDVSRDPQGRMSASSLTEQSPPVVATALDYVALDVSRMRVSSEGDSGAGGAPATVQLRPSARLSQHSPAASTGSSSSSTDYAQIDPRQSQEQRSSSDASTGGVV